MPADDTNTHVWWGREGAESDEWANLWKKHLREGGGGAVWGSMEHLMEPSSARDSPPSISTETLPNCWRWFVVPASGNTVGPPHLTSLNQRRRGMPSMCALEPISWQAYEQATNGNRGRWHGFLKITSFCFSPPSVTRKRKHTDKEARIRGRWSQVQLQCWTSQSVDGV